jgi:hypothetical protein
MVSFLRENPSAFVASKSTITIGAIMNSDARHASDRTYRLSGFPASKTAQSIRDEMCRDLKECSARGCPNQGLASLSGFPQGFHPLEVPSYCASCHVHLPPGRPARGRWSRILRRISACRAASDVVRLRRRRIEQRATRQLVGVVTDVPTVGPLQHRDTGVVIDSNDP